MIKDDDPELLEEYGLGGEAPRATSDGQGIEDPDVAQILSAALKSNPALIQHFQRTRPTIQHAPLKSTDYQMPMTLDVNPGQTETVTIRPRCIFRAEKFIGSTYVTDPSGNMNSVNGVSEIISLSIGRRVFNQIKPIPLEKTEYFTDLLETCQPAMEMSMTVKNTGSVPFRFYGCLFGKAIL